MRDLKHPQFDSLINHFPVCTEETFEPIDTNNILQSNYAFIYNYHIDDGTDCRIFGANH